ncbi:hypothetical protein U729_3229 (plasmid) [Clostridium baratii str. Sullivan]|uniref:Uncharacterized protein n=1 Tax=Clostridium baratii str. Sullivan TaxID=1415775 RepID=A0A0A7G2U4_9CLOT|nr:hypothetical protein [Clostridium baratii]AIY85296.1 hypothetical protein U729_3229 [Clostridium baratii str. Sullivan]
MLKYLRKIFNKNKKNNITDCQIEDWREQISNALSNKVKEKKTYSEEFVREYYENLPEEYDYNGFGKYYKDTKDA